MKTNARKKTCAVLEAMDNGLLDPRVVAEACLNFMSEYEVGNMVHAYELLLDDDEGEDVDME